jgi:VanZ family protein
LLQRLLSKWIVPAGWTLLVQVLLCLPGQDLPSPGNFFFPDIDKLVHLVLFGGIVWFWAYFAYRKNWSGSRLRVFYFLLFIGASFNGILMEYIQLWFIPGRSYDTGDMLLDVLGAGLAYGMANIKLLKTIP